MNLHLRHAAIASSLLVLAAATSMALAHTEHADQAFGRPGLAKDVSRSVDIHMTDNMRFTPGALSFDQGQTIRLRIHNDGKIPHELVLGNEAEIAEHAALMRKMPNMVHTDASSVRVAPGASADLLWTFSHDGRFLFACLIPGHRESGMQGTLTVRKKAKA